MLRLLQIVGLSAVPAWGLLVSDWSTAIASINDMTSGTFMRITVLQVTIVGGVFALAYFGQPKSTFVIFVVMKLLWDLASQMQPQAFPAEPPRGARRMGRWLGGEDRIVELWHEEARRREYLESPLD